MEEGAFLSQFKFWYAEGIDIRTQLGSDPDTGPL